jgi:CheY-like chemotaxis protein
MQPSPFTADPLNQSAGFEATQPVQTARQAEHFEETRPLDWEQQMLTPDYEEVIAAMSWGEHLEHNELHYSDRKRVLVVDDDLASRLYLRAKLSLLEGIDVYEAASGDEALYITETTPFDGVLMDVNMQGRDGYQICRAIKRNSKSMGAKVPKIYIVTSRTGVVDRLRASFAGADAFMSKPPHPGDLHNLLASL